MLRRIFGGIALILLLGCSHLAVAALPGFSNVIYFGDSLTDMGNEVAPVQVPCVLVNAPITSSTGTNGGNTWANINSSGFFATPSKLGGNDWAVAGSETNNMLYQQVPAYLATVGGVANPSTLYVIWGGANDILDRIFNANPHLRVAAGIVIEQGMANILRMLINLYDAGARHFLVIGVPNIGLAPLASSTDPSLKEFLVGSLHPEQAQVAQASLTWNGALFSTINSPETSAPVLFFKLKHPDADVFVWDPNPLLNQAVSDPPSLGFPATINGFPNNQEISCPSGMNPDLFIFFNFLHPTSRAHTLIAQSIRATASPFP